MTERYLGENNPKLGFGFMRVPVIPQKGANWTKGTMEYDYETVKQMVDYFMENGFNTFHTAWAYENNEAFLKKVLIDRYPRDSYIIVDNLPVHIIKDARMVEPLFYEMLEHLGVDRIDYVLFHMMRLTTSEMCEKTGAWDFIKRMRDEGKVGHIGFSFHDSAENLDKILTAHPEVEVVQLQINYADWDTISPDSRGCYEVAWKKHHKPFFVMEPVKGGILSADVPAISDVFGKLGNETNASWAVRWVQQLDGLITMFSGMTTMEQMADNVKTVKDRRPLTAAELDAYAQVVENLKKSTAYQCTHCRYCVPLCPMHISCCDMVDCVNDADTYHLIGKGKHHYDFMTGPEKNFTKPAACIRCGNCESHCPQHLPLIRIMARCAEIYDDPNLTVDQA